MIDRPLWTIEEMAAAMHACPAGPLPRSVRGISIDTRTIAAGEAFFAIRGDHRNGHDFVLAAIEAGAGLAVIAATERHRFREDVPLLVVEDVLDGLRDLARAARARSQASIIGVTGSVGKTGTKEALRLALGESGETHASAASYNNHWGVPLSLARCPESARYAVFELGMNHSGEIEPLARLLRPQVAIVTAVEPVHLEFFRSIEAIADAKAEIFLGLVPRGATVINRDNRQFARLARSAKNAGAERIVSFGEHARADARLLKLSLQSDSSTVVARILGTEITYKLGAPGRHLVLNSLAVLAAVSLVGADLALAALKLADLQPAVGRGSRLTLDLPGGTALLLDESYNANPASMRAALALLGNANIGSRGRRIAVLGDMLELGSRGAELHRRLAEAVLAHDIDLVFCCGTLMHGLWQALPPGRRGGYAENSAALMPQVLGAIQPEDAVMVKGSLGSRMALIVKALASLNRREPAASPTRIPTVNG
jgi:UDP-N-acetylmuramoyl-tripeptide--D-alanyl-D-alanine ligase